MVTVLMIHESGSGGNHGLPSYDPNLRYSVGNIGSSSSSGFGPLSKHNSAGRFSVSQAQSIAGSIRPSSCSCALCESTESGVECSAREGSFKGSLDRTTSVVAEEDEGWVAATSAV
eukprot:967211-Prymnesium_polylepis.2